jgi:hypothetical protein
MFLPQNYADKINSCVFDAGDEKITGVITAADGAEIAFTDANIAFGSLSVSSSLFDGGTFGFGSARPSELKIALLNFDGDAAALGGAKVQISYFLNTGTKTAPDYTRVPFPAFYVDADSIKTQNGRAAFSAFDATLKFDGYIDDVAGDEEPALLIGTPFQLLTAACEKCGAALQNTQADILTFPNGGAVFTQTEEIQTWRDLVGWVAAALGAFCKINRSSGALELFSPLRESRAHFIPEKTRKSTNFSLFPKQAESFILSHNNQKKGFFGGNGTLQLEFPQNPLTDELSKAEFEAFGDNLKSVVFAYSADDCAFAFFGDAAFEAGEKLSVEYRKNDGTTDTLSAFLTAYEWRYGGFSAVQCSVPMHRKTALQIGKRRKSITPASGIPPPFFNYPSGEYTLGFSARILPPDGYPDMEIFYIKDGLSLTKYTAGQVLNVGETADFWTFGIVSAAGSERKISEAAEFSYVVTQPSFYDNLAFTDGFLGISDGFAPQFFSSVSRPVGDDNLNLAFSNFCAYDGLTIQFI